MSEWIKNEGCRPVTMDVAVAVKFFNGSEIKGDKAVSWNWEKGDAIDLDHDEQIEFWMLEEDYDKMKNEGESKFETKDSGSRAEFDSGMVRDTNEGKARFELLLPEGIPYEDQFLTRVAELMSRGASKYSERNFEKADGQAELNRFKESALRHMYQYQCGDLSEDHASAVVFNLLGAEMVRYKMENK